MQIYDLNEIFKSPISYKSSKKDVYESILANFQSRHDIVSVIIGEDSIEMTKGRLLLNLLVMRYFVIKDVVLCKEYLFHYDAITEGNLEEYFNFIMEISRTLGVKNYNDLKFTILETLNEMSDMSGEFNVRFGSTISFRDIVRAYSEDEEARYFLDYKLGDNLQFHEIEDDFHKLGRRITKYFSENTDSELHHYAKSKTGINEKQLTQALGVIGLKPDIFGDVIPIAINDNYFRGLSSLESYFINAKGTRKALITNMRFVRSSGYLTRKISLAMVDRYHDHDLIDSGSKHFVLFKVDSPKKRVAVLGRHYYDVDDGGKKISDELHTVTETSDIVGKTIGMLSPVTSVGKHVSRLEYGSDLSEVSKNINTGLVATLLLTNPLTQKLLSAKHLLLTDTDKVEWGEHFLDYFSISMNTLYFSDFETNIRIDRKDVVLDDEEEELPYTERVTLLTGDKKQIEFNSPVRLFLDKKIMKLYHEEEDDESFIVSTENYDDDEPVFTFIVKNNELTKSLEQILDLIESSGHLGITNYNDMVNKFNDLIIENGLDVASVHAEMIISVLIRDKATGQRLDFSKEMLDEYEIVRVSKAIMLAPITVSLAFERINEQLVDIETYTKEEESLFDYLYM